MTFETPPRDADPLIELLHRKSVPLIQHTVDAKLGEPLSSYEGRKDDPDRAAADRNQFRPEREVLMHVCPVSVSPIVQLTRAVHSTFATYCCSASAR